METLFLNLQEKRFETPSEAIEAFFAVYSSEIFENQLWKIFRVAVLGGLGDKGSGISAEEVASLFDQLITLVAAAENMHRAGGAFILQGQKGDGHE